jgi:hypothetical protein
MACYRWIALAGSVVACLTVPIIAYGQDLKYPPKPHREIDGSTLGPHRSLANRPDEVSRAKWGEGQ